MALDFNPESVGGGFTGTDNVQANFESLETLLEDALSRSGTTPNTMSADIDMNGNQLANLPNATSTGQAVSYQQWAALNNLDEFTGYSVETLTATAGQTTFTLTNAYTLGINSMRVYINGVYQPPSAYSEDTTTQITFSEGLDVNDEVSVVVSAFTAAGSANASAIVYEPSGTGAVTTNVDAYLSSLRINVKDFGALGDNANDDTAEIQAAIDYAESLVAGGDIQGAAVYLPHGHYIITSALTINQNGVGLVGDGRGSTIIRTTNTGHNLVQLDGGTSGAAQRDNFVTGIQLRYNAADHSGAHGMLIRNCIRPLVRDVMFWQLHGGISMDRVLVGTFDNIYMETGARSVKGDSVFFLDSTASQSGDTTSNHFTHCELSAGGGLGGGGYYDYVFDVQSSDGLYVDNCHFSGAETNVLLNPQNTANQEVLDVMFDHVYFDTAFDSNIIISGQSAGSIYRGITFSDCYIRNSDEYGIVVNATTVPEAVQILGGEIRKSGKSGIKASATAIQDLVVNGTIFDDNNEDASSSDGDIDVQVTGANISNTVHIDGDAAGNAIRIRSGSTDYHVLDPHFSRCTQGDFFIDEADANGSIVRGVHRSAAALVSWGDEIRTRNTADATPTTIWTYTLSDDESMTVEALVHAASTTVANSASYKVVGGAYKDGAAAAALTGATTQAHVGETDAGMNATLALNGNILELQITGVAATTIRWGTKVSWIKRQE